MKSKLDTIKNANPLLEIQFKLRDISYVNSCIPKVFPMGVYDFRTQEAVRFIQKENNINETGKINFETWNAIMNEHKKCKHCIDTPQGVNCYPRNILEYKKGDECSLVFILQIILKDYHRKYKNYVDVQLTGVYDEQTEKAIMQFQKYSNLPVTGILDRQTWNLLNKIHNICILYE